MKYLRKARLEEGSDWLWAIGRAHLFVNEQIRKGSHYAAVLIESSLVETSIKFLMILQLHSKDLDLDDRTEVMRLESTSETVYDESFARNIDRAVRQRVVSTRLGKLLHDFRRTRNELIHDALFSGITVRNARRFVSSGNQIMNALGPKIAELMKKF